MVLAHAGGVPEAASIGVPLLLFGLFLWWERRVRARQDVEAVEAGEAGPEPTDDR